MRGFVLNCRAQWKTVKDNKEANLFVQPEPTSKDLALSKHATTPAASPDTTPRYGPGTRYYLRTEPLMEMLEFGKEGKDAVKDMYLGMYRETEKKWVQNMTCPRCGTAPGDPSAKHKFLTAEKKYREIRDAFLNVDLEKLQEGSFQQSDWDVVVKDMYELEDMYLTDNLDVKCEGLHGLKKGLGGYGKQV
jgi:hypothetical protein